MPIKHVDAQTLQQWMDSNEVVLIDVREPYEHQAESIPGAILQPLATISVDGLPRPQNGEKIVLHCRAGIRSMNACQKLLAENPQLELYNLDGGIMSWMKACN